MRKQTRVVVLATTIILAILSAIVVVGYSTFRIAFALGQIDDEYSDMPFAGKVAYGCGLLGLFIAIVVGVAGSHHIICQMFLFSLMSKLEHCPTEKEAIRKQHESWVFVNDHIPYLDQETHTWIAWIVDDEEFKIAAWSFLVSSLLTSQFLIVGIISTNGYSFAVASFCYFILPLWIYAGASSLIASANTDRQEIHIQ